jgi:hypothetical protein
LSNTERCRRSTNSKGRGPCPLRELSSELEEDVWLEALEETLDVSWYEISSSGNHIGLGLRGVPPTMGRR